MEHTTIKYIIRSLVILEAKQHGGWHVPGLLGIVHTDVSIVEGPGGLQQQQRRWGSSSSDSISRYISSTASSRRSARRRRSSGSSSSSSISSSSGINIRGRRGVAVAATSAGIITLSSSCSYGISRCNCYTRINSIQSQGKPWLLLLAAAGGAGCG